MYSIETTYYDTQGVEKTLIVFDDSALDQRVKVVDPVLELEDNSAGSLSFTLYGTNQAYGEVTDDVGDPLFLMTSTVRVFMVPPLVRGQEGVPYRKEEIWEGRPLTEDKDFYNGKKLYCEGALCYLNDIDQPFNEYSADSNFTFQNAKSTPGGYLEIIDFIKAVLTVYNERAALNRKFDIDGVYVNPVRIPLNYNFKGCLTDLDTIKAVSNPHERDIYQTMEGLTGYQTRGFVQTYADLPNDPQTNDICYVISEEAYYRYTGTDWHKTHLMDYVGEYYVYGVDPKDTSTTPRKIWSDVTSQIHVTCGVSRSTGGGTTKEAIGGIVESLGGHLKVRTVNGKRCLYYTAKIYPEDEFVGMSQDNAPQSVQFGKNLIDLTKKRDGSEFFTVLLPVGAQISSEHPETIESMCVNVIENLNSVALTTWHTDLSLDTRIQPYDSTAQFSFNSYGRDRTSAHPSPRRSFQVDMLRPGYTYYLFTNAYNQDTSPGSELIQNNTYMYFLYDSGPNRPNVTNKKGGVAHPYYYGQLYSGETYLVNAEAVYKNDRLLAMKQLTVTDTVQSVDGEAISIPLSGSGNGYTLYFTSSILSARTSDANRELPSNPSQEYKDTYKLLYPKLYIAPYPDKERKHLNVRKVDPKYILWSGCSKLGGVSLYDSGTGTFSADPHKLSAHPDKFTDEYGRQGYYFTLRQDQWGRYLQNDSGGSNTWHIPLQEQQVDGSMWKNPDGGNTNWIFYTGQGMYRTARVLVEPGKTYYLNTRVTNPGFPKSSYITVQDEKYLPDRDSHGEIIPGYWPDDVYQMYYVESTQKYAAWVQRDGTWGYYYSIGPDPAHADYSHSDGSGEMHKNSSGGGGRDYYDVIAYAVVARKTVCKGSHIVDGEEQIIAEWRWQILDMKLAERSQCATVFNMEEIKIPDAVPPEATDIEHRADMRFYDPETGNSEPFGLDAKHHLELWFMCDACYLDGNGEYDDDYNLIGYVPEVFVEDAEAFGDGESHVNYKDCVTIKPLQKAGCNGENWPEEYLINKELYDKYGPIVKVAQYENAFTPAQLMNYAQTELSKMTGEESFEVSALDLMSCGLDDCDRLRLMQKIKIDDDPHGVNASIVLSKMSINLADLTQNSYTLGYEANRGISAM